MNDTQKGAQRRELFKAALLLGVAGATGDLLTATARAQSTTPPSAATPPVAPIIDADARAEALLKQMTLEEKVDYVGGVNGFDIRGMERLGIPQISMTDGPQGVRDGKPSTAYPGAVCVAAAWDLSLARRVGTAMGRDCRARGHHILLSPGVNIYRVPQNGRNFEYFGEDPFLAGQIASASIKGIQSQGVLACVKHFAVNNQETDRNDVSAEIDERTLREIYLPAFHAAIHQGGVGSVMNSYNKVNGVYATANTHLNLDILRRDWGFKGILMSDWGATHDAVAAANGGLDLEMPGGDHFTRAGLLPAVKDGRVPESVIDDKVRNILRTIIQAGFFERPQTLKLPLDDPQSARAALDAARGGMVLLKNQRVKGAPVLPLRREKLKRLLVVGPNAQPANYSGGGSGRVDAFHAVSVLDGVRQLAGDGVKVDYFNGLDVNARQIADKAAYDAPVQLELWNNRTFQGAPTQTRNVKNIAFDAGAGSPFEGINNDNFSARWTARFTAPQSGAYRIAYQADDGVRIFLDGEKLVDRPSYSPDSSETRVTLDANTQHELKVEYTEEAGLALCFVGWERVSGEPLQQVQLAARQADAVIACLGFNPGTESEGSDRAYELPAPQLELLRAVANANPRTIVVLNAGGAVAWNWLNQVPALLHAWYPGQEGGHAVAEVLFGDTNPSGKLPATFEKRFADNPASPFYLRDEKERRAVYGEGIFVGYRGYDHFNVEPQFPFGFGLSYTTFAYRDLQLQTLRNGAVEATFSVKNTGRRAGAEVAQLYVAPPQSDVPRPPRELKGFAKLFLQPGETRTARIVMGRDAFAFWHPQRNAWTTQTGAHTIQIGSSSRDLRLKKSLNRE